MHDARHESLAGAGLSVKQQGRDIRTPDRVEAGQVADLLAQRADGGRIADQAVGGMPRRRRA